MVNSIRMGGLVSGLDTETIVKNLMKAESSKLNTLLQKKQTEEWRRDQYREVNTLLLDFKNKTFDMKLQSNFQKKVLTSDNDSIVAAKQKGTPSASSYNINVQSLPEAAKAASVKFETKNLKDGTTAIGESFDFKIGSTTISVSETDTINSLIAKVNSVSSSTGVTASYLNDDKSITFTTKANGTDAAIEISGIGTGLALTNKLGLSSGKVNSTDLTGFSTKKDYQLSEKVKQGELSVNGISYKINSSTFTFDGIEFTIKDKGTTQINLKTDEDAIFKSIKDYIDKYNEVIDKINTKTNEKTYRDFKPLLSEEKESLSEKQIEQWETKAKSGLLRQDPMLNNVLSQLRLSLSANVKGAGIDPKYDSFSKIGITTGEYSEKGKLYINESKLREAISQNEGSVMELFTKVSTSTDSTTKLNESGLTERLYDQINVAMTKLSEKAGSNATIIDKSALGKVLSQIDTDISNWKTKLERIEQRYWSKFTAMETAMSKANSQSSWLTQQFSS